MGVAQESTLEQAGHIALLASQMPDVAWLHGDDLCDCMFQRIGEWTNPYIARTLRVRFCCIWDDLFSKYPDLVQEIPAFNNYNAGANVFELLPREWDSSESDMPRALWYRQIQTRTGQSLAKIRAEYSEQDPPSRKTVIHKP